MNKTKQGFTLVELLVVIGILGILMGVLFPTITTALMNAKTNACAMQGNKLYQGIIQADIKRQQLGLPSVWPRTSDTKSDDSEDIAGSTYDSAEKYFSKLFDIDNYGKTDWEPYVGCDLSVISGSGVAPYTGSGQLKGQNVLWSVARGVEDDLADAVPVLVSRNCNTKDLVKAGTEFKGTETTKVNVGKDNGAQFDVPFGNKAWVLVRKSGATQVVESRYSKQYLVYMHQGFTISSSSQFEYIDPSAN